MSRAVGGTASSRAVAWAWNLVHDPPPPDVRRAASRLVLASLSASVAAALEGTVDDLLAVPRRTVASGPATLLDGTAAVTVEDAALGNGLLLCCLDLDDRHALTGLHASASVLPAALAVAEQVDATGMDLLAAHLIGTEVALRLASAAPGAFAAHGLDVTSVVAPGASALAVSWLRELEPEAAQHAVGVAGGLAAGPVPSGVGVSTAHLVAGAAARDALLAADLAAVGARGPDEPWEGPAGILANHADRLVGAEELMGDLGEAWFVRDVALQRHPCSPLVHGSVDAALSLSADGVRAEDVEEVVAVVHPDAAGRVCRPSSGHGEHGGNLGPDPWADPEDADRARRSLPWCVATALVDGRLDVDSFRPASVRRPDVLDLAARVRCEITEHPHGPAASQPGHVKVVLGDAGGAPSEEIVAMAPGGLGGPDHPLDDDELVATFVDRCGGDPHAEAVAARVLRLEDEPSVVELVAAVAELVR